MFQWCLSGVIGEHAYSFMTHGNRSNLTVQHAIKSVQTDAQSLPTYENCVATYAALAMSPIAMLLPKRIGGSRSAGSYISFQGLQEVSFFFSEGGSALTLFGINLVVYF